jgi:hypothetical protein
LTSPPYCTRIDYAAATRIELAVLAPLTQASPDELSRQMMGSTRVPPQDIQVSSAWGSICNSFLEAVRTHPSRASSGYYYRTHLDYFDKLARSIKNISEGLKSGGQAILVAQDSHYKNVHNDLPAIIVELGEAHGLTLQRRADFRIANPMSGINPHTRTYRRRPEAVEAVLMLGKR